MPFIGNKPSAVPLTSADITDNVITSAKIVDGTITNTDIASSIITGQTAETSIAGGDQILIYDDSATALRKMTRTNFVSGLGSNFSTQLFHLRDEKSSGTGGGTSQTSYTKRDLNTSVTNEISGASLSSSVITLPSGTYYIFASAPIYSSGGIHKLKLRNTTDSSDTLIGTSEYNDSTQMTNRSFIAGRFTINAQKNFELQHKVATSQASNGLGVASSHSITEVYADVQIWKVA